MTFTLDAEGKSITKQQFAEWLKFLAFGSGLQVLFLSSDMYKSVMELDGSQEGFSVRKTEGESGKHRDFTGASVDYQSTPEMELKSGHGWLTIKEEPRMPLGTGCAVDLEMLREDSKPIWIKNVAGIK